MQLDFFDDAEKLEIIKKINDIDKSVGKIRRSLFARINDLEKTVLDLIKEIEEKKEKVSE